MTASLSRPTSTGTAGSGPRLYSIFLWLTVLFIFVQSFTAGEFITDGLPHAAKETWTDIHGYVAYPVMVFALASAVVAFARLRREGRLAILTGLLFVATVLQWLSGHAISTLGMDWVTPYHVVLAFVIYGLTIYLAVRAVRLARRRA